MTTEEFWQKWMPCDHPPIVPDEGTKAEFMADLKSLLPEAGTTVRECLRAVINQWVEFGPDGFDECIAAAAKRFPPI